MRIKFEKNGMIFTGELIEEKENSVIVELSEKDSRTLNLKSNRTVVSKKRIQDASKLKGNKKKLHPFRNPMPPEEE